MEVRIGELSSTVRTSDDRAVLDPRILEQVTAAVLERIGEQTAREQRLAEDRDMTPAIARHDPLEP
jgi:hypothetical protein